MKKFMITLMLIALFAAASNLMAQEQNRESLGLPGDNLNLYAVMKLFQESETLEGFEKKLNDENSRINNLDLNNDNYVDYIKVIDYVDRDVHNIVLQVALNNNENQDVAAFTVQRDRDGQVQIQLTGDEELYGRDYIIEPIFDEDNNGQTPNPGYMGNTRTIDGRTVTIVKTTRVEIATWPLVRFIYLPDYVTWHSSWHYDYYPPYWSPWRPYYWDFYYGYHYNWYNNYYAHYRRWDHHRYDNWNDYYWVGRRSHSSDISVRIKQGDYKNTYSHPDQRRDGEALYNKSHQDQNSRPSERSSGNSVDRRSGSQSTQDRQSTNTRSTRRSPSEVTNKSESKSSTEQKASTSRRTPATVTDKSVAKSSRENNAATTRRSTPSVTDKPAARSQSDQKAATSRTSEKPAGTGVSKSSRRNSGSSKPAAAQKKPEKVKDTDKASDSRRK
jgi:hypothetical protein